MASSDNFDSENYDSTRPPPPGSNPPAAGAASGGALGTALGGASSSGFMRIALFMGTNMAIMLLVTVVLSVLGIEPTGIVGLAFLSLAIGMGGSLISLLMSKGMAKRATKARVIETPQNEPEQWLVDTVARLAQQAGIGMPEVAVFPSADPNAFATGAKRDDALVAVSTGLFQAMDRRQVEAVLAHEVAHIANGDMITLSLIQGVLNAVVFFVARVVAQFARDNRLLYFATVMALQFGLGILASMIVMWFSRRREYRADAGAASLVGAPAMASALAALQAGPVGPGLPDQVAAFGIKSGTGSPLRALLASHPDINDRIAALQGQ